MSDDIRVYWESGEDIYYICIHGKVIFKNEFEASRIDEEDISVFELVYDSAEHEDYSLIDENLVVPDVANNAVIPNGDLGWKSYDTKIWIDGYSRHKREHEERTA